MRILFTVTGAWGTGSFQVAKGVAKGLKAAGHEVKIFFPDSKVNSLENDEYYLNKDLYEIWRFPIQNGDLSLQNFPLMLPDPNPRSPDGTTFKSLSAPMRALYFNTLTQNLDRVIKAFRPDVIECQHIWAMDAVVDKLGHPFIAVAHNSDQIAFEYDSSMRKVTRKTAQHAKFIFAVSDAVKAKVIELYRVPPHKVIVTPCGYETQVFFPQQLDREATLAEFDLKIPKDARIISFAGKISKTKGIDILLKANKLLPDELKTHFIIMGSGDINQILTDEDKKHISLDRVHFIGHRKAHEVAKINNISEFSVIPSRSEGFCIAGLEAIACGTPLVMTKGANVASYAVAKVVADEDPGALANALSELLSLPDKAYQTLKKEAEHSAANFSWKKIIEQRLQYYKAMMPGTVP